jgi:effector-binding domain-containing protein
VNVDPTTDGNSSVLSAHVPMGYRARASLTGVSDSQARAYAVIDLPEQPFVGVTKTVTMSTMNEIADEIGGLVGWVLEHGQTPAGAPFLRYLVIDMAGDMVVQAGVPVAGPMVTEGVLEFGTLPAGRYASTRHVGHPEGLYGATVGLLTWAGQEGLRFDKHPAEQGEVWANRVESYETNPMEQPDMDQWVTRLTFKLAD